LLQLAWSRGLGIWRSGSTRSLRIITSLSCNRDGATTLSGIPEVDMRIRRLVQAIFRSQGMLREYFTDLFPYMRETVRKFNLEDAWNQVYKEVVTGDYELDRLSIFLDRLLKQNRELFASFLGYVIGEVLNRFHEPKDALTWFFQELKNLGFEWNGKKLISL
jgi:hypothetical protein